MSLAMHERRFTEGRVELRLRGEGDDTDKRTIGGYAAKFGKRSEDLGGFYEVIDPKAFNQSRGRGWPGVLARYNHDDNMLLGTTAARTLRLDIDDVGLFYEADTPRSRDDVFELVQRGDVTKSSFAFLPIGEDGDVWELDDNNRIRRTLQNVRLFDVAPVNSPAYEDTTVKTRSIQPALRSLAHAVEADPADVLAAYEDQRLDRFFRRTDGGPGDQRSAPMTGASALIAAMSRRH